MAKVKTGIPGLDEATGGGFEKGAAILVSGGPGVGKSTLGLQFAYSGALAGENVLYISFEESLEDIYTACKIYNFRQANELIKENRMLIKSWRNELETADDFEMMDFLGRISSLIKSSKATRTVLDTTTTLLLYTTAPKWVSPKSTEVFSYHIPNKADLKRYVFRFISELKSTGTTCVFLAERTDSLTEIQKYACDTVIELFQRELDSSAFRDTSFLRVGKTRRSPHTDEMKVVKIGSNGMSIHSPQEVLREYLERYLKK